VHRLLLRFVLVVNDLWMPKTLNRLVQSLPLTHVIKINNFVLLLFGKLFSVMVKLP
jgi:hypothetical protein